MYADRLVLLVFGPSLAFCWWKAQTVKMIFDDLGLLLICV